MLLPIPNWSTIILLVILILWIVLKLGKVKEESVLVVKELGIQLERKYFNGKVRHVFVDINRLQSVLINESFHRCSVLFYLCFQVKDRKTLVLAFEVL